MSSYLKFAGSEWPFIGLRPFQYGDHECFFGREEELNVLEPQVTQKDISLRLSAVLDPANPL